MGILRAVSQKVNWPFVSLLSHRTKHDPIGKPILRPSPAEVGATGFILTLSYLRFYRKAFSPKAILPGRLRVTYQNP